jgi:glycine/serine hydroxymethyltransferase
MGEPEMREIASIIADAIDRRDDPAAPETLAARVAAIAGRFPVPGLARPA